MNLRLLLVFGTVRVQNGEDAQHIGEDCEVKKATAVQRDCIFRLHPPSNGRPCFARSYGLSDIATG